MAGTLDCDPTATTMLRARSSCSAPSCVTTTRPAPAIRAAPRIVTAPAPASPDTWPASLGKSVPSRLIM